MFRIIPRVRCGDLVDAKSFFAYGYAVVSEGGKPTFVLPVEAGQFAWDRELSQWVRDNRVVTRLEDQRLGKMTNVKALIGVALAAADHRTVTLEAWEQAVDPYGNRYGSSEGDARLKQTLSSAIHFFHKSVRQLGFTGTVFEVVEYKGGHARRVLEAFIRPTPPYVTAATALTTVEPNRDAKDVGRQLVDRLVRDLDARRQIQIVCALPTQERGRFVAALADAIERQGRQPIMLEGLSTAAELHTYLARNLELTNAAPAEVNAALREQGAVPVIVGYAPSLPREWIEFHRLINDLKQKSSVILVQAVNPKHSIVFRTTSGASENVLRLESGDVAVDQQLPELIWRELQACCQATIASGETLPGPCTEALIKAGILDPKTQAPIVSTWAASWRATGAHRV